MILDCTQHAENDRPTFKELKDKMVQSSPLSPLTPHPSPLIPLPLSSSLSLSLSSHLTSSSLPLISLLSPSSHPSLPHTQGQYLQLVKEGKMSCQDGEIPTSPSVSESSSVDRQTDSGGQTASDRQTGPAAQTDSSKETAPGTCCIVHDVIPLACYRGTERLTELWPQVGKN